MEVNMDKTFTGNQASILYIPHGGGPLPLLYDDSHQEMVDFLHSITPKLGKPEAVLIISAHWEEPVAAITGGANPPIIYDYYGFPEEAYQIT
jgi:aromatic ring-opening dioxygenase catalytic subunit (LigB family)